MNNLELKVKKANKDFYNIVGEQYEDIDGRRSEELTDYVSSKLKMISGVITPILSDINHIGIHIGDPIRIDFPQ